MSHVHPALSTDTPTPPQASLPPTPTLSMHIQDTVSPHPATEIPSSHSEDTQPTTEIHSSHSQEISQLSTENQDKIENRHSDKKDTDKSEKKHSHWMTFRHKKDPHDQQHKKEIEREEKDPPHLPMHIQATVSPQPTTEIPPSHSQDISQASTEIHDKEHSDKKDTDKSEKKHSHWMTFRHKKDPHDQQHKKEIEREEKDPPHLPMHIQATVSPQPTTEIPPSHSQDISQASTEIHDKEHSDKKDTDKSEKKHSHWMTFRHKKDPHDQQHKKEIEREEKDPPHLPMHIQATVSPQPTTEIPPSHSQDISQASTEIHDKEHSDKKDTDKSEKKHSHWMTFRHKKDPHDQQHKKEIEREEKDPPHLPMHIQATVSPQPTTEIPPSHSQDISQASTEIHDKEHSDKKDTDKSEKKHSHWMTFRHKKEEKDLHDQQHKKEMEKGIHEKHLKKKKEKLQDTR